jgi:glycosyltransferase involved in cell wall biosynthesis
MYYGTVPVTFTIPGSGVNWVNQNGLTGLEVERHDPKAYAEAIDKLLSNEPLRQQFASAAMKRVRENFLVEHIRGKLTSLYDRLLEGNS